MCVSTVPKVWQVVNWFSMQLDVISGHCGIVVKWVQVMTCQESALTKQWPVSEQTVWPHCLMPRETGSRVKKYGRKYFATVQLSTFLYQTTHRQGLWDSLNLSFGKNSLLLMFFVLFSSRWSSPYFDCPRSKSNKLLWFWL